MNMYTRIGQLSRLANFLKREYGDKAEEVLKTIAKLITQLTELIKD